MKDNFNASLKLVLQSEGGYVDDVRDPGGMTNLGVTKRVWEEWTGHDVDEATMRNLTPEMVAPLYKQRYWDRVKGDDLPSGIDYACFDFAVNGGVGRSAKILQEAAGVTPDGSIGDGTIAAVKADADILDKFCQLRGEYYQSLPAFDHFGKGWMARVEFTQKQAKEMEST